MNDHSSTFPCGLHVLGDLGVPLRPVQARVGSVLLDLRREKSRELANVRARVCRQQQGYFADLPISKCLPLQRGYISVKAALTGG